MCVENAHRSYGSGAAALHALRGVSFDVPRGELVALKGRSGSGKTTLLNLVGGLDEPDEGQITLDGLDLSGLGEDGLLELCRDRVGFVFQSFGLNPHPHGRRERGRAPAAAPDRARRT